MAEEKKTTLEEVAKDYCIKCNYDLDSLESDTAIDAFKAGVEWQKEQMLKDAVEGNVVELGEIYKALSIYVGGKDLNEVLQTLGVKDGDKVNVIIVKEDKE